MKNLSHPIHIIGVAFTTTNDQDRSLNEIPLFWHHFINENVATKIQHKIDHDIFAVYTNFENEGKNNQGMYSYIIGCRVTQEATATNGFTKIIIPPGNYRVFPVEKGRPDKVAQVWQSIWAIPNEQKRAWQFKCEFERYYQSGEIEICVGIK